MLALGLISLSLLALASGECGAGEIANPFYGMTDARRNTQDECVPLSTGYVAAPHDVVEFEDVNNNAETWLGDRKRRTFPATINWNPKEDTSKSWLQDRKHSGPAADQGFCGSCVLYATMVVYEIWFNMLRFKEAELAGQPKPPKVMIDITNQAFCRQKARNRQGDYYILELSATPHYQEFPKALRAFYENLKKEFPDKIGADQWPSEAKYSSAHKAEAALVFSYLPQFDFVKSKLLDPSFKIDPTRGITVVNAYKGGSDICHGAGATEYMVSMYQDQQTLRAPDKPASATRGVFTFIQADADGKLKRRSPTMDAFEENCAESATYPSSIGVLTPISAELAEVSTPFDDSMSSSLVRSYRSVWSPARELSREEHQAKLKSTIAALQYGPVTVSVQVCSAFKSMRDNTPFDFGTCKNRGEGHRIIFIGYELKYSGSSIDEYNSNFIIQNSWPSWADRGFGRMRMTQSGTKYWGHVVLPLIRPHDTIQNPLLPTFKNVPFPIPLRSFQNKDNRYHLKCSDDAIFKDQLVTPPLEKKVSLCPLPLGYWYEAQRLAYTMPLLVYNKVTVELISIQKPVGNPTIEVQLDGESLSFAETPQWTTGSVIKNARGEKTQAHVLRVSARLPSRPLNSFKKISVRTMLRENDALSKGGAHCAAPILGNCMSVSTCRANGGYADNRDGACSLWNELQCCEGYKQAAGVPKPAPVLYLRSVTMEELNDKASAALRGESVGGETDPDTSAAVRGAFNIFSLLV